MLFSLYDRSPLLTWGGALLLLFGLLLAPLLWADSRTLTGLPIWAKPIKFAISGGVFLLTMGWLLADLRLNPDFHKGLSWAFLVIMWGEILLIALQALRGVPSHFNISSPLNASIFASMGVLIGVNTVIVLGLAVAFALPSGAAAQLAPIYRWGVVGGLALLLVSSAVGGVMIGNHGHTVGAPDGGPGLPFLGWSTTAGDLRWAHFVGMHAIQLVLLAYILLPTYTLRLVGVASVLVLTTLATVGLYVLALRGMPVVRSLG